MSKAKYVIGSVLLAVAVGVTFALGHERRIVPLAIESLCLFLPGFLLYGAILGVKAQFDEFKKTKHWAEIFVIIIYVLFIMFYLLLIVLLLKAFGIVKLAH